VLFDGVCVFCNGAVRWLLARDPGGELRYATLQGETAAALRARHPEIPEALETFVYVEPGPGGERVFLRSDALLRVLSRLDTPLRRLAWLRVVPRWLRDALYLAFARMRYRLFGQLDACSLPRPEEKARFLP
jgi:predicted DCC family thiol-disulfide oxidoreductase YuxK